MKGKKSISAILLTISVVIGAYFFGGEELVLDILLDRDSTAPIINIDEMATTYERFSEITFEDVTCTDDTDETCTVEIIGTPSSSVVGEESVILTATDTAGNKTTILFEYSIIQSDVTAPVIDVSLLRTSFSINSTITFEGLSCTDDYDDVCEVDIIGTTDSSVLGEFIIEFQATDSMGNFSGLFYTYSIVEGLDTTMYVPFGYYDGIDGLNGQALITALNAIITDHTEFPYTSSSTDVWDILRDADEDPDNSNNIIMFYTGVSHPKDCQDTTNPPTFCEAALYDKEGDDGINEIKITEWNREHIWSKSRGPFAEDSFIAHNDTHHLVAAERAMNSTKNNRYFEDCHDGDGDTNIVDRGYGNYTCNDWEFEPRDDVKGDVARMLFYMAVRYEGHELFDDGIDLVLANDPDADKSLKLPIYGDIDDLLRWHLEDPVSQWELDRNETIYSYQGNRNPFIDHPELVELIWGNPEDYN